MAARKDPPPVLVPEFSRPISLADHQSGTSRVELEASAAERRALAKRFDLLAIDSLTARARLRRDRARDGSGPALRVELDIDAVVVQSSVVTLESLTSQLRERNIVVEYGLGEEVDPAAAPVDIDVADVDPPEPVVNGEIDLGELVAEHLALALDPYPREPDAVVDWSEDESRGADDAERPFAALSGWRRRVDPER